MRYPRPNWILNAAGEPEQTDDIRVWGQWFERATRDRSRILAQDRNERRSPDEPEVLISTVFLGLDHQWASGPPILWETMIFGGPLDGYQERYSSRAAALDGHARACASVQKKSQKLSRKVVKLLKSFRHTS